MKDIISTLAKGKSAGSQGIGAAADILRICRYVMFIIALFLPQAALTLPKDGTVAAGSSTISQPNSATMHINQTTHKSIINWKSYSIGANEKVQYFQPSSSSISLNRVIGVDPSYIHGQLSANGQVWVINPNGLLVGNGARINVGGFVGSTLNMNNEDFMNGRYRFIMAEQPGAAAAGITNQGHIEAERGGYAVLISPSITNEGTISSPLGTASLASGNEVTLNFAGNELIGFTIDKAVLERTTEGGSDAGITNKGSIAADGGQVIISAKVASDVMKTVVNNEGHIAARTIENRNGRIYLLGGMENNGIMVGGVLDASAPAGGDGGFIETSAAKVDVGDGTVVTTDAPSGRTGTWLIDPTNYRVAPTGGNITGSQLSTNLGTTGIIIQTPAAGAESGDIFINDAVSWSANTILTLEAHRNIYINKDITATGDTAGMVITPNFDGDGSGGSYSLDKAKITLSGGSPSLFIAGNAYTVINDVNALQNMNSGLLGRYALGSDIDASATASWNSGAGFVPVGKSAAKFWGTLDGLGHTINGLYINRSTTDDIGLFGYTSNAAIRNVGVTDADITGRYFVGGLVGYKYSGTVSNSYSTGVINGYSASGGLVGMNAGGTISYSHSTCGVTGTAALAAVGGLVGINNPDGTITHSYSYSPNTVQGGHAGGLVGMNDGTISNCYAITKVIGTSGSGHVGGLAGINDGTIIYVYSAGNVSGAGSYLGSLVGYNDSIATISDAYCNKETSGQAKCVGNGDVGCTGLTTEEMKQKGSFPGWDFSNNWAIGQNESYPYFIWNEQLPHPGTGAGPGPGPQPSDDGGSPVDQETLTRIDQEGLFVNPFALTPYPNTDLDKQLIDTNIKGLEEFMRDDSNKVSITEFPDGTKQITVEEVNEEWGTSNTIATITIEPDGTKKTEKGSITTIEHPDGTIEEYAQNAMSWITTKPDGTRVVKFIYAPGDANTSEGPTATMTIYPDGRIITKFPDNSVKTENPDGTIFTEHPDGMKVTKTPDGITVAELPDGTTVTSMGDEGGFAPRTTVTERPDGTVITQHLGGTTVTELPDGTTITEIDGTTVTRSPDGTTITQKTDGLQPESVDFAYPVWTTAPEDPPDDGDRRWYQQYRITGGVDDDTKSIKEADGTKMTKLPDGTTVTSMGDKGAWGYKTTVTERPDGTVITRHMGGTTVTELPDGTTITEVDGTIVTRLPEGKIITEKAEEIPLLNVVGGLITSTVSPEIKPGEPGTIISLFPSGTTVTEKPDGMKLFENPKLDLRIYSFQPVIK
ncbi:MAG TPA: filamentous hemagglutinin N-terminal domain-containing protein [Syntrophorhabdaceae bacterium]|nr:filamentous hemagglutinin N-terminal domain-containing protein [Syntrophorhabdaceae bacterium]